jgi:DNA (cytosine-5)-methyltransferase 1
MHPDECRKYSIAEARRVASFPDGFRFAGRWCEAMERIGNSVPPNLMRAIAEHVRREILGKATRG